MTDLVRADDDQRTYPRPEGPTPRAGECPVCGLKPNGAHKDDCPWLLWAKSPADHTGHRHG